jgi:hypothetical protein
MTQDITTLSTDAVIASHVRGFIYADTDGSQRVNEAALSTWLAEQFSYLTTSGASPNAQVAQAQEIAHALQGTVARERWLAYPDYPNGEADSTATKARLASLVEQMASQVVAIEAAFRTYDQSLATKVKALFNSTVLPSFPAGVQIIDRTCAYVETFVTDWGEESAPSPVSDLITLDQNDSATVTCSAAPTGRHITLRRLYRSATGTTQSAYKLQGEYPISQTVIVDAKPDEQLNEVCPTFGWLEPPAGLQGLTGMANGIMLGFVDRTLHASEPYKPYAYPAKYDKPLAHQITGIVALGQSAFVGTTGRPYLVSGSDSASLSEELISSKVPCVAAPSMVAIGSAVFYASPNGLALYENGQVNIITEDVIDRATWQSYGPETMRAGEFDGRYIVFFTRADASRGALMFDYKRRAIVELDQSADAVFSDEDGLYVLDGTAVLDLIPASGSLRTGHWTSKEQHLARPQAFAWAQVQFSSKNSGEVSATLRIYGDGVLHHTLTISDNKPVRTKPGRHTDWRVEIDSAAIIDGVVLATSTDELKAAL